MSFDTITFWLFFPIAWAAWRFLPFGAAKTATLLLSLLFYAWWNPWYLSLILLSAVVDFRVGLRIHGTQDQRARRRWMLASLLVNLGLLAVFKYTPFLATNSAAGARMLGFEVDWEPAAWIVPVGISFYTFQTLSYSLDIYRRQLAPITSFRDFFLYVSFFPQLVAGPIVRATELLPQFQRRRPLRPAVFQTGLYFVVQGLFFKVVVADNLAPAVNQAFLPWGIQNLSPVEAWLGASYFGVQIFADFAGYSGIAIGLAYMMGLHFPLNFNYPYISRGLSEFWTRWHITLSRWLRDYLYIPLGGNRKGALRTYGNLMITMLLGGLWHGASWTFVAWGGLHGLGLCVERLLRGDRRTTDHPGAPSGVLDGAARVLQIVVVFAFVTTTWVFFRAPTFEVAWDYLARMWVEPFRGPLGVADLADARHLVLVLPIALLHLGQLAHEWFGLRQRPGLRFAAAIVMLFLLTVISRRVGQEFIYFQF